MIRAEDLMIGDWVRMKENQKIAFQMEDISGTGMFKRWTSDGEYMIPFAYDEIEPIPLVPEILLKNGFENDFYEDVSVADYDSIRVEGYSLKGRVDGWDDFLITFCNGRVDVTTDFHGEFRGEIYYVHTFQHALRLCGINLEIKI